LTETAK